MRTGARGIFPAYYAHEVIGQTKDLLGKNQDKSVFVNALRPMLFVMLFLQYVLVLYITHHGIPSQLFT